MRDREREGESVCEREGERALARSGRSKYKRVNCLACLIEEGLAHLR